jgi:penicillin-binding protein 1A
MGITPDLVSGAWVGGEDRSVHFENLAQGSGSSMALPIWALYMKKVYEDKTLKISQGEFEAPSDFNINLDCKDVDDNPLNFKPIEGED